MIVRRLAMWLVMFGCLVVATPAAYRSLERGLQRARGPWEFEETERTTAYVLSPENWLEFDIPRKAHALRLVTNAGISDPKIPVVTPDQPRFGWRYALQYELLDGNGKPIHGQPYHLRTTISEFRDPRNGQSVRAVWFAEREELLATQTRSVQIPVRRLSGRIGRQASRLRVRLVQRDDAIEQVVMRAYMRHPRSDFANIYTWSRLGRSARHALCRASVYPPDLITDQERKNLLRWTWSPLPVRGIESRDFHRQYLYRSVRRDLEEIELIPPQSGTWCGPGHRVTFEPPWQPGSVRLVCRPWSEPTALRADRPLALSPPSTPLVWQVRYHHPDRRDVQTLQPGSLAADRLSHTDRSDDHAQGRSEVVLETQAGLLEVIAQTPCRVEAWWFPSAAPDSPAEDAVNSDSGQQEEDEPLLLEASARPMGAYRAAVPGIDYSLLPVADQPTPVRIILRRAMLAAETPIAPSVDYWAFDAHGQKVLQGKLPVDRVVSTYDQACVGITRIPASDPTEYYLRLPSNVCRLRFCSADPNVAVTLMTRPPGLPVLRTLPEQLDPASPLRLRNRAWFIMQPVGFRKLIADSHNLTFYVQARPHIPDDRLLAGQYISDSFVPDQFWMGQFALVPRDTYAAVRPESARAIYARVTSGSRSVVRQLPYDGPEEPLRVYYQPPDGRTTSSKWTLWGNGRALLDFFPQARFAEGSSPERPLGQIDVARWPVAAGESLAVQLAAPRGATLFLQQCELPDGLNYTRRMIVRLPRDGLRFPVVKRTEQRELIVLRGLSPAGKTALGQSPTVQLHVRMETLGETLIGRPLADMTLFPRRFDCQFLPEPSGLLLQGRARRLALTPRCFIPLGADIPAGTYYLSVRPTGGPAEVYVVVYRTLAGRYEQRDVWRTDVQSASSIE